MKKEIQRGSFDDMLTKNNYLGDSTSPLFPDTSQYLFISQRNNIEVDNPESLK